MELGIEISNEFLKNLTKNLYLDLKTSLIKILILINIQT